MDTMELLVHRTENQGKACTGTLDLDGAHECFTLEDSIRKLGPNGEGKIHGETGIPAGRYQIIRSFSQRFQRDMPRVMDVPFFTGILIHSGNSSENTEGCLLVGQKHISDEWIQGGSIEAPALHQKIFDAIAAGKEVWITYVNEFPEEDLK